MRMLSHTVCLLALACSLCIHAEDLKPLLTLKVSADYLALHVTGKAPADATALQYRLAEAGTVADNAEWLPAPAILGAGGAFALDISLKSSLWSELQLRAMKGGDVLVKKETHSEKDAFELLTPGRIAALPEPDRTAWADYMTRSAQRSARELELLAAECRKLGRAESMPAPDNRAELELDSDTPDSWFAGVEAQTLADAVMSYQTPTGGWSKAIDFTKGQRPPGTHWTSQHGDGWHYCGTLDNRTTTEQVKLLAGVFTATKRDDAMAAALRGIGYLLEAQFPNGGWPQNYPVEPGYHEAVTLNDNAMVHVLEVLLAIANNTAPFAFTDAALRQHAQAAFDKGIRCLLAAQVKVDGALTVWCAQHDPLTLAPVAARKKEPPSLSGGESTELLRFLMRQGPMTAEVKTAVEAGVAWLDAHRITQMRKTKNAEGKTDYIADSGSQEVYWARFYDVQTSKPMFAGAQDGIVYATFSEMAAKNKVGYDYFTTKPRDVIEKELPRWKKRMAK